MAEHLVRRTPLGNRLIAPALFKLKHKIVPSCSSCSIAITLVNILNSSLYYIVLFLFQSHTHNCPVLCFFFSCTGHILSSTLSLKSVNQAMTDFRLREHDSMRNRVIEKEKDWDVRSAVHWEKALVLDSQKNISTRGWKEYARNLVLQEKQRATQPHILSFMWISTFIFSLENQKQGNVSPLPVFVGQEAHINTSRLWTPQNVSQYSHFRANRWCWI